MCPSKLSPDTAEMTQWKTSLPCKREAMSSNLQSVCIAGYSGVCLPCQQLLWWDERQGQGIPRSPWADLSDVYSITATKKLCQQGMKARTNTWDYPLIFTRHMCIFIHTKDYTHPHHCQQQTKPTKQTKKQNPSVLVPPLLGYHLEHFLFSTRLVLGGPHIPHPHCASKQNVPHPRGRFVEVKSISPYSLCLYCLVHSRGLTNALE